MAKLLIILFFFTPLLALAGATDRLINELLPKDTMYNKTGAAILKDQSGGHITGGSLIIRPPAPKELSPINIQMPHFKLDPCTGSGDFRFGGLSFISSKEMVEFFHRTAKSVGMYALKMAIKTNCPQCETIMTELEEIARQVSQFSLEQCSFAQNIVGGLASKLATSDKQRCMIRNILAAEGRDLHTNMENCNKEPDMNLHHDNNEEIESLLGNEFNLVWKALKRGNRVKGADNEFAEMVMSISGTIIGKKEGGKWKFTRKESLFKDSKQLAAFMGSFSNETVNTYKCNEHSKCLEPYEEHINLGNKTVYRRVTNIITSLTQKVAHNDYLDKLSDDERDLINFSTIPIINMIEQELIEKGMSGNPLVSRSELIELICYDMVTDFLTKLADIASRETKNLELGSNEPQIIEIFIKDLDQVKQALYEHKMTVYQRAKTVLQVKDNFQQQKDAARLRFAKMFQNNNNR